MNMFNKKKPKNILRPDDIVLLAMLNFPQGAVGESIIHEFVYQLLQIEPYKDLNERISFSEAGPNLHFSHEVHRAIVENCRDVTNVERGMFSSKDSTPAIFSDNLRFEAYEDIYNKEKEFAKFIPDYSPKIYFLTAIGRSVAILALREKLNREQKNIIAEIASEYVSG